VRKKQSNPENIRVQDMTLSMPPTVDCNVDADRVIMISRSNKS